MKRLFFDLIKVSLSIQNNLQRMPSEAEWHILLDMASKQSLVGVCFAGIVDLGASAAGGYERIGMSYELFFDWMGRTAMIQQRNEDVSRYCAKLQADLASAGLRSCVLKGQGVAASYGSLSLFRQPGDIDMWVDGGLDAVIRYVSSHEKVRRLDNKHIHFHCFPDTEVELHWTPLYWYSSPKNKILQSYFKCELERQFSNVVDGMCVPTADFQLVHQMLHIFGHYMYEGIGLRQLMDLFFAQRAFLEYSKTEDEVYNKVVTLFGELGLMRFVAATQWVLQEVFGLHNESMLCEPDNNEGDKLLDEILIGGNFGQYDERNRLKKETFTARFGKRWKRSLRMFRFNPLGTILLPFSRIKLEVWMNRVGKKYGID